MELDARLNHFRTASRELFNHFFRVDDRWVSLWLLISRAPTSSPLHRRLSGTVPLVVSSMKLSATPVRHEHVPPLLGEHTSDVLRNLLAMDEAEIDRLSELGIV